MVTETITPPNAEALSIGRRNTSASHIALPAATVAQARARSGLTTGANDTDSLTSAQQRRLTMTKEERREWRKFNNESRRVSESSASILRIMQSKLEFDRKENQLLRAQLDQLKMRQGVANAGQAKLTERASGVVLAAPTEAELAAALCDLNLIREEADMRREVYERELEEVRKGARELQEELGDKFVVDIP